MFSLKRFRLPDVEVFDQQSAYRGFLKVKLFTLRHKLFGGGWSGELQREILERREAVGVLPYDPTLDSLVLIEQFRIGAFSYLNRKSQVDASDTPWMMELVAGLMEPEESPEQVAIREAREEAGVDIQRLEPIHDYFSSPGGTDEFCRLYCGLADLNNVSGIHGLEEEDEDIRVHVLSIKACKKLMAEGRIINAHTLIALQWFMNNHERLRQQWRESER